MQPCTHSNSISYIKSDADSTLFNLPRSHQIILSKFLLRVTKITHLHIITKSNPEKCPHSNKIYTLYHIFIECPFLSIPRSPLITYCHSHNKSFNLDTILKGSSPPVILIDFLKASDLLEKI